MKVKEREGGLLVKQHRNLSGEIHPYYIWYLLLYPSLSTKLPSSENYPKLGS